MAAQNPTTDISLSSKHGVLCVLGWSKNNHTHRLHTEYTNTQILISLCIQKYSLKPWNPRHQWVSSRWNQIHTHFAKNTNTHQIHKSRNGCVFENNYYVFQWVTKYTVCICLVYLPQKNKYTHNPPPIGGVYCVFVYGQGVKIMYSRSTTHNWHRHHVSPIVCPSSGSEDHG